MTGKPGINGTVAPNKNTPPPTQLDAWQTNPISLELLIIFLGGSDVSHGYFCFKGRIAKIKKSFENSHEKTGSWVPLKAFKVFK